MKCSPEEVGAGLMSIPYIRDVSEKFECIAKRYNIKTVFKTSHTLRDSFMRTGPVSAPNYIYCIPCKCGRSYNGETGRPCTVTLRAHMRNLEVGHLERSKLAQHSFEENHHVLWKEAMILETERKPVHRKYKEVAYIACL
jgi:predicted GIY-YIG superfamily endonuclease